MSARFLDRVLEALGRVRVLAADVEVALLASGRDAGDRERFDHRERVLLRDHAVLERAGLALVGVADEVVRMHRLLGDRLPLHTGWERGAASAHQLGVRDLSKRPLRPVLEREPQRLVPFVRPVVVDRSWIDVSDPAQESEALGGLQRRSLRVPADRPSPTLDEGTDALEAHLTDLIGVGAVATGLQERGRRHLAQTETWAPQHLVPTVRADRFLDVADEAVGTMQAACDVVADVEDRLWAFVGREHRVERRDAVGLGGRHREPFADVVHATGTDPACCTLQGVQRRQQQMAVVPSIRAATGHPVVERGPLDGPVPRALGRARAARRPRRAPRPTARPA